MTDDEQLQQWENEGGASVSIPSDFPSMTEWDRMVISLDCQSNQYDVRSQKVRVTR